MTIVVTGASGKTGRAIIEALLARGRAVRPFTHHAVSFAGTQETAVGDLTNPDDVHRAMRGVEQVYHICPNMHPLEVEIGQTVIEAARAARVHRIVYHSVLHPQIEAMPHHWRKLRVEALLFASGLPFTILQPTAYMQNIALDAVRETAVYNTPYPIQTRLSLVDVADVAQVAATVLTEQGHDNAIYELVGEPNLSQEALAQLMSEAWGEAIVAWEQSLEAWETAAQTSGMPEQKIAGLKAMFDYYARYGMVGNTAALKLLLGRKPTRFAEFLQRESGKL